MLAELLAADPIGFAVAEVTSIELAPGDPGKLRFLIVVALAGHHVTLVAEVTPRVEHTADASVLAFGIGPDSVIDIDRGDGRNEDESAAYRLVRTKLLSRIGDLTAIRVQLPPVPVAQVTTTSTSDAMTVEVVTTLPVRRGLEPSTVTSPDITVALSGSTVAELANWAIDSDRAPQWYSRSVKPDPEGEFRPRFDYVLGSHPFKVYSFQERGGCSYFRVGVAAEVHMEGEALVATALDRRLEESAANPAIEAAAWVKYFLIGALDKSKSIAARTEIQVAGRPLVTRVVSATYARDEVIFGLRFEPASGAITRAR